MPGGKVTRIIKVKDFSTAPGGRYINHGPFSGEEFRNTVLIPAFKSGEQLLIDLDGTFGYASCFIDEVFGEMARLHGKEILKNLFFKSNEEPNLIEEILSVISLEKK